MPLDLALDLAHALDPVAFVQDRLKFKPDPWQAQLLRSQALWILLNCCRQSGKSTTTAAVALHTAIYNPGLILLVSPSLRPRDGSGDPGRELCRGLCKREKPKSQYLQATSDGRFPRTLNNLQ